MAGVTTALIAAVTEEVVADEVAAGAVGTAFASEQAATDASMSALSAFFESGFEGTADLLDSVSLETYGAEGLDQGALMEVVEETEFNAAAEEAADSGMGMVDTDQTFLKPIHSSTPMNRASSMINLARAKLAEQTFSNSIFEQQEVLAGGIEGDLNESIDESTPLLRNIESLKQSNFPMMEDLNVSFDDTTEIELLNEGGRGNIQRVMEMGYSFANPGYQGPLPTTAYMGPEVVAASRVMSLTVGKVMASVLTGGLAVATVASSGYAISGNLGIVSAEKAATAGSIAGSIQRVISYIQENTNLKNLGLRLWKLIKAGIKTKDPKQLLGIVLRSVSALKKMYDELKENKDVKMGIKVIEGKIYNTGDKAVVLKGDKSVKTGRTSRLKASKSSTTENNLGIGVKSNGLKRKKTAKEKIAGTMNPKKRVSKRISAKASKKSSNK